MSAVAAGPFIGFDTITRSIATALPNAAETYVVVPKKGFVTAYVIEAEAPHPNARSYVWLEAATARVIQTAPYARASTGFRAYYWMMSLHTGMMGGPVVQCILLFGALSVLLLAYTGPASYLRRKYGKPAALPAGASAATSPIMLARSEKVAG